MKTKQTYTEQELEEITDCKSHEICKELKMPEDSALLALFKCVAKLEYKEYIQGINGEPFCRGAEVESK